MGGLNNRIEVGVCLFVFFFLVEVEGLGQNSRMILLEENLCQIFFV